MSHGPCGLGGAALVPPGLCAIVNVAPISVSASASIGTRLILVFMFVLSALPSSIRHREFSRRWHAEIILRRSVCPWIGRNIVALGSPFPVSMEQVITYSGSAS